MFMLAQEYVASVDPTGWWISEKLDGVRALWDGQRFLSRNGNAFAAPEWFRSALPSFALDGELWAGRGGFERAAGIARMKAGGDAWRGLHFAVFDAPTAPGAFHDRLAVAQELLRGRDATIVDVVSHWRCEGHAHLQAELLRIVALGGEGLVLRDPNAAHRAGPSPAVLKVKACHDAEAVVVSYKAGCGHIRGRVGALVCRTDNGLEFTIGAGLTDADRAAPPQIGSVITYRYRGTTAVGKPRFASFFRVRSDAALLPE